MIDQVSKSNNYPLEDLRELPKSGVPEILKEMEIGSMETGYYVPLERLASVRVQVTNINNYSDKVFTTGKNEAGKVILWRIA